MGNSAQASGRAAAAAAGGRGRTRGRLMEDQPWHVRRRRELVAAAPVKRRKAEPFVKVPLWWAAAAAKASRSPATLVLVELLYASWKAKSLTFSLPNGRLQKVGVSRKVKLRVLRDYARAGLIRVERPPRKAPIVTIISL